MTRSKGPGEQSGAEYPSDVEGHELADTELVVQLRARDARAFKVLFEKYFDTLIRFAYYLLKSEDAAQDIVQDVFINVWDRPEALDPSRSLKRYLYRAVQNRALNERRNESVRVRHQEATRVAVELDPSVSSAPSLENTILRDITVQEAIGQLPERRQQVLRLRIHEQLTPAEIGQIFGISAVAAERLIYRALDDLRKILRVSG